MQDNIAKNLYEKLSLTGLPQVRKDEILRQLDELIQTRVALAISERLDDEANGKMDKITESGTADELEAHIKQYIPDYDSMVMTIAEDTVNELANNRDAVLAEVERLRHEE